MTNWHDEKKYAEMANRLSDRIKDAIPNALVLYNKLPKKWKDEVWDQGTFFEELWIKNEEEDR